MSITTLDAAGIDFIKSNEGFVPHVYKDSAGVNTIGYGFTYYPGTGKLVKMGDPTITQSQADIMLGILLKPYQNTVASLCRKNLSQAQFNALVDFEFNTGHLKGSTLLVRVNANATSDLIKQAFLMWDKEHVNGILVENSGLKERREREADMYNADNVG